MSQPTRESGSFGNVPKAAESFSTLPNSAEDFRTIPKVTERNENHTLTVREVARMFEAAGVARTERSIINWCQLNKLGVPRLDAYFDPNERRYFITSQSVELAIKEEQARAAKSKSGSEPVGTIPEHSEARAMVSPAHGEYEVVESKELRAEINNLKIANGVKDMYIEKLNKEREDFALERRDYVDRLINSNRHIGELETRLLQLDGPTNEGHSDGYPMKEK